MSKKRVTISLDSEAYRILRTRKSGRDTWSDVIKREVMPVLSGKALDNALAAAYGREKNGHSGR